MGRSRLDPVWASKMFPDHIGKEPKDEDLKKPICTLNISSDGTINLPLSYHLSQLRIRSDPIVTPTVVRNLEASDRNVYEDLDNYHDIPATATRRPDTTGTTLTTALQISRKLEYLKRHRSINTLTIKHHYINGACISFPPAIRKARNLYKPIRTPLETDPGQFNAQDLCPPVQKQASPRGKYPLGVYLRVLHGGGPEAPSIVLWEDPEPPTDDDDDSLNGNSKSSGRSFGNIQHPLNSDHQRANTQGHRHSSHVECKSETVPITPSGSSKPQPFTGSRIDNGKTVTVIRRPSLPSQVELELLEDTGQYCGRREHPSTSPWEEDLPSGPIPAKARENVGAEASVVRTPRKRGYSNSNIADNPRHQEGTLNDQETAGGSYESSVSGISCEVIDIMAAHRSLNHIMSTSQGSHSSTLEPLETACLLAEQLGEKMEDGFYIDSHEPQYKRQYVVSKPRSTRHAELYVKAPKDLDRRSRATSEPPPMKRARSTY